MGRSVSYPAGSVVAFRLLDDGEDADVDWAYECLVDEIIDDLCHALVEHGIVHGKSSCEELSSGFLRVLYGSEQMGLRAADARHV